jgi:membrane associated rhomboid family serine protease
MRVKIKITELPYYLLFPVLISGIIFLMFLIEKGIWEEWTNCGVRPRTLKGLPGILWMNFIHKDTSHLLNNLISFLIMSSLLFYFHRHLAWKILLVGMLLTGTITWIIGRPDIHIGMSGVNYLLFSFLVFSGLASKNRRLSAISLILIFLYGGLVWLLFPLIEHISWEAHLSGFITGIFFTYIYIEKIKNNYPFDNNAITLDEVNDFVLCFDENGNFIEKNSTENELIENS